MTDVRWDDDAFNDLVDEVVLTDLDRRAQAVLEAAKRNVPVDTGKLRDSLRVEHHPDQHEVRVVTDEYYGYFVETGTRGKPGTPFLRSALAAGGS